MLMLSRYQDRQDFRHLDLDVRDVKIEECVNHSCGCICFAFTTAICE